jgi:sec-independent protein translocase protein TatA
MFNVVAMIGPEPLLLVFILVLVLFGGKKIPELMRGVGRGVGELQKGLDEGKQQLSASLREDPNPIQPSVKPQEVEDREKTTTTSSGS